ncbi:MAG: hypothetical protein CGU28_10585 [Candidatus Dactylopiibacterium carminicum]|uniref:Oxidoreductase-like domain-containing protein n=2 Tax=Candidatus Dactylopiibacterium carminicum TaxID=857335 RepID=A0A272EQQ2_9RHOO|nr:hypothetical protein BGI27_12115 [Candidatus Dactylopiibacterium carminicum]PAS92418.1 MAG: hypothetical protein CGU29_11670 [Candidatus Dactylopiibacterium carminicum]PAS96025.1 MAG: hypothetical protein CGU28_10585 [Candidatus Dactylopiibacterium carminicum]PAS98420.1 MAG: hypothetical protein BSR46_12130 [Candidatus Dactylopiibacterium carminicum]
MPPEPPGDFDCCQNGCGEACVWEIHEYAKRDYARKLAAWLARHPEQV